MQTEPVGEFATFYRSVYEYIGYPLEPSHRMAPKEVDTAESRLSIKVPSALSAYYHVAGKRDDFNLCLDELLPPDQWYVHNNRLVFYHGHQACVAYGIHLDRLNEDDPAVEMGNGPRPEEWFALSPSTTNFLQVTTYWQGVYAGAMVNVEWAKVQPDLRTRLDADWEYIGECNDMFCYRRPRQVSCFLKWDQEWHLHAGSPTPEETAEIARDLGIEWVPWC